ncbi:hypothetical protein [Flavobacterium sp. 25HG05S-40]|uniref:hypothetical protein n=1 Tax=Flavobacterium sp. 25HG05S-40 TaxID=3458682 RepID=UPI0040451827
MGKQENVGRFNDWKNPIDEVLADLHCNNTNKILSCNSIFLKRNFIFATYYN